MPTPKPLLFGTIWAIASGLPLLAQPSIHLSPRKEGTVHCTISNPGHKPVRFLRFETPLANESESSLFRLERKGETVPYTGKLVMRARVAPEDWVELQPGESISCLVDLAENYALQETGAYTLTFRHPIRWKFVETRRTPDRETTPERAVALALEADQQAQVPVGEAEEVVSNAVDILLNDPITLRRRPERRSGMTELAPPPMSAMAVGADWYYGCDASWTPYLASDKAKAQQEASRAWNLMNNKATAQRPYWTSYKTWFGTYSSGNYLKVMNAFASVWDSFNKSWTVNCNKGCQSTWAAWVYANETHVVQVCAGYWGTPAERPGTLLHEATHWSAVLGALDHAYWETNSKNLALSSPSKAVMNADSYRLFSRYAM